MIPTEASSAPLGTGTAPGKVILLGEHAVVYGAPAIAVPVTAVEARATIWSSTTPLTIHAYHPAREGGQERVVDLHDSTDALAVAVRVALERLGLREPPRWSIDLASTVPTGRGMGSSAATAVALVRAVGRAVGVGLDDAAVSALAFEAERVTHGTPSGIDNTVIAGGRPIRFAAGSLTPLVIRTPLTLLVADSGVASPTRDMVSGVRARRAARPTTYSDWIHRIGRLADDAVGALCQGELRRLGQLMNSNHLILQAMRVSTPRLDQLVGAALTAGALGAKVSGAGGGGVIVALATADTAAAVARALSATGAVQVIRTVVEATA
jgi:mevalonate kinase